MAFVTLHLSLKNFLSAVLGVCVIGLALIPLVVPVDHLGWPRWKTAIIALAVIGIIALVCQALRQSREEKEQWDCIQVISAKLDSLLPSPVQSVAVALSRTLKDSDPRIYVEFSDDWEGIFNHNSIVLVNRGGTDAHKIHATEITLRARTVAFDRIVPVIAPGHRDSVEPHIEDYGVFQRRNIARALMEEWNSYNDLSKNDLSVALVVTYEDFEHSVFQTSCSLTLNPFHYLARSSGRGAGRPVTTVEHFDFSRVATSIQAAS